MPDIVTHFVHGYLIFGKKGALYAILPDLLSFGRLFIKRIPEKIDQFKKCQYSKLFQKPQLEKLDKIDHLLYNIFHSLIIWSIFYYFKKDKEIFSVFLAIVLDVFLHKKNYLPTPFLYPLSDYKFNGIPWNSKLGWIISIIITIFIYHKFKIN